VQLCGDFSSGPFHGYNRSGAVPSQAAIYAGFRQRMAGDIKAQ
jgi:hypothetical protein